MSAFDVETDVIVRLGFIKRRYPGPFLGWSLVNLFREAAATHPDCLNIDKALRFLADEVAEAMETRPGIFDGHASSHELLDILMHRSAP